MSTVRLSSAGRAVSAGLLVVVALLVGGLVCLCSGNAVGFALFAGAAAVVAMAVLVACLVSGASLGRTSQAECPDDGMAGLAGRGGSDEA